MVYLILKLTTKKFVLLMFITKNILQEPKLFITLENILDNRTKLKYNLNCIIYEKGYINLTSHAFLLQCLM